MRHGERGAVAVEGGRATDHLIQQEKPALVVPDKATGKSGLYRTWLAGEVGLKTAYSGRGWPETLEKVVLARAGNLRLPTAGRAVKSGGKAGALAGKLGQNLASYCGGRKRGGASDRFSALPESKAGPNPAPPASA